MRCGFFFYKGSSHNFFWSWLRWIYKAPIVLLRLGDIPVSLCFMEILMSMLRRWIWQLNAKLLTFKCSSLGLVYHYDIIFPKGYWVIFSFMFFKLLNLPVFPIDKEYFMVCWKLHLIWMHLIQTNLFTFDITCIIWFYIFSHVAKAKCCHLIQASDI